MMIGVFSELVTVDCVSRTRYIGKEPYPQVHCPSLVLCLPTLIGMEGTYHELESQVPLTMARAVDRSEFACTIQEIPP